MSDFRTRDCRENCFHAHALFADYSSGSEFARDFLTVDNFLELGTTELQMFENANIIDPNIEDGFRRDLY